MIRLQCKQLLRDDYDALVPRFGDEYGNETHSIYVVDDTDEDSARLVVVERETGYAFDIHSNAPLDTMGAEELASDICNLLDHGVLANLDSYSTPQPCAITDCQETNEGQDLTGTIFLFRGYDSRPLCPNHYRVVQFRCTMIRLQ